MNYGKKMDYGIKTWQKTLKMSTNKMCLGNTNTPATAIFLKTLTFIFDLDLDK